MHSKDNNLPSRRMACDGMPSESGITKDLGHGKTWQRANDRTDNTAVKVSAFAWSPAKHADGNQ
jgi:hypothetical protein